MKILFTTILILLTQFAVSETQSISCKNFEGVSVDYSPGKPDLSRDGYSGMTITLRIDDSGETTVTYSGSNQRTDILDIESANDDFICNRDTILSFSRIENLSECRGVEKFNC